MYKVTKGSVRFYKTLSEEKSLNVKSVIPTPDLINYINTTFGDFRYKTACEYSDYKDLEHANASNLGHNYADEQIRSCALKSVINRNILVVPYHINSHIKNLRKIGADSVFGDAYIADFIGKDDIVIKRAKVEPGYDVKEIRREVGVEALIGLAGVNRLRHLTPNFIYTYGTYTCAPQSAEGKGLGPCDTSAKGNDIPSIVIEAVDDAVTFGDFFKTCTKDELISVLCQVAYSLTIAYQSCGFVHKDLHYNNVLVTRKSGPVNITYKFRDNTSIWKKLTTTCVAKIIDYGQAKMRLNDQYSIAAYAFKREDDPMFKFLAYTPLYDMRRLVDISEYGLQVAKRNNPSKEIDDKLLLIRYLRDNVIKSLLCKLYDLKQRNIDNRLMLSVTLCDIMSKRLPVEALAYDDNYYTLPGIGSVTPVFDEPRQLPGNLVHAMLERTPTQQDIALELAHLNNDLDKLDKYIDEKQVDADYEEFMRKEQAQLAAYIANKINLFMLVDKIIDENNRKTMEATFVKAHVILNKIKGKTATKN